jgi:hypothetical protein
MHLRTDIIARGKKGVNALRSRAAVCSAPASGIVPLNAGTLVTITPLTAKPG